jgi:dihydrofolate reductase
MVVAVSQNNVIGSGTELPWKLRSDLQRFKQMTMGHCLLMGRATYESIGRPLPGRQSIVLSRTPGYSPHAGVQVVSDLDAVESIVERGRRVMVIGGGQIYRLALQRCTELWLTRVMAKVPGDVFLPDIDWNNWQLQSYEPHERQVHDDWPTQFEIWTRSFRN